MVRSLSNRLAALHAAEGDRLVSAYLAASDRVLERLSVPELEQIAAGDIAPLQTRLDAIDEELHPDPFTTMRALTDRCEALIGRDEMERRVAAYCEEHKQ